jgi:N-acetylneuraminic acid mutarotase
VDGVNFDGAGQFKFALVNTTGSTTYWSNDGTSTAGSQPTAAVTLTVTKGLYSVLLGDATLANMTIVPATVFTHGDVHLRIWFNDGTHGFEQLAPDKRIAAVGYAMMAADVPDGIVTASKLAPGSAAINLSEGGQSGVASGGVVLSATENPALVGAGYLKIGEVISTVEWQQRFSSSSPTARRDHTAVWTGSEMIIWGGFDGNTRLNTGGRYNPLTDSWSPITTSGAPSGRRYHTAIWTGSEMLVWGGELGGGLDTGGRYNPTTDTWSAITPSGPGRYDHTAVWTGSEMIIWGGLGTSGTNWLNSGGRYSPATDTWSPVTTTDAPTARNQHTAVWTGTEMIIWGGQVATNIPSGAGARYNPNDDAWVIITTSNAPAERMKHSAVWTGTKMIVWGGSGGINASYSDGKLYDPGTNNWTVMSSANTPFPREQHTGVWTGTEMIVWGGHDNGNSIHRSDGARYNPSTTTWVPIRASGSPSGRLDHTAVWTGSSMLIWGGFGFALLPSGSTPATYLSDLWYYAPAKNLFLYQRP